MYNLIRNTMVAAALFAVTVPVFAQDAPPAAGAAPQLLRARAGARVADARCR